MDTITGYIGDSSSWAISLTHPVTGAAFTPGNDYGLVATFKNRESDPDSIAVIQKATGAGITVSGSTATVTLVRADTEGFCECNLHFGIRATHNDTGASFTVAEKRVKLEKPTTLETTTSVDVVTTETPLPFGGVTSYVDDIETLPDYPTSFPTTPADINNVGHDKLLGRHGAGTGTAQEIGIDGGLELQGGNLRRAALTGFVEASAGSGTTTLSASAASEGGNGAADAGKLVKFGEYGGIVATSTNEGGVAFFANTSAEDANAFYGASSGAVAGVFVSTGAGIGNYGISSRSVNAAGISTYSTAGTYHAEFGQSVGNDRCAIERVRGWFVWFYSTFVGRLKTADITANRDWTLPDASGTVALLSGAQTFTDQITLSGQAATSATSAMTRGLADARYARSWGAALASGVNSDINTTTYKTVTEMSFDLDVGTYFIECILLHNGNANYLTSGCKDRLNFTGTATASGTLYRVFDNAATGTSVPNSLASRSPLTESAPSNRSQVTWRTGTITVTAAGQLQVQIAQSTAVAAAFTTLDVGSSISITKV